VIDFRFPFRFFSRVYLRAITNDTSTTHRHLVHSIVSSLYPFRKRERERDHGRAVQYPRRRPELSQSDGKNARTIAAQPQRNSRKFERRGLVEDSDDEDVGKSMRSNGKA
jgi:hypothetical protein